MTSPYHANHRFASQQLHPDSAYRPSAARSPGRSSVVRQDRRKANRLATASLAVAVLGALSLYGAVVLGPVGAILGHVGLRRDKHHRGGRGNSAHEHRGVAIAGIALGWITAVLALSHGLQSGDLLDLLARAGSLVA
ncbi:DUF4190 domain-containing protein [Salinifilum ghardaiensis]